MVKEIESAEEFTKILSESGDALVIVDFTASWCPPCKAIAPKFRELSEAHTDLVFLKVDVDKCSDVAKTQEISSMPTFKFFKGGKLFHVFSGGSVEKIVSAIAKYSPVDAEPDPEAEGGGGRGCTVA
mmetsp:Transcript_37962/g.74340  ORF Transcript_37962/g.74340 Transcript_37962/m.74340 type:complete len:127 (-) Transcript_37962:221-601(-)|eukprot:CAMPEP_0194312862 /NCGR_PEP_ID=MMETSP0171-20130528/9781_1 /TAXON_ID=218684 /ORGANISM="Corethron pennatum, Strain L29A3" /LENGTH=126 /DNA_ID=CAMNT_0039067569 /DNA_START=198 /DNA_END=578 /DNA_ORIENTATION=+